MAQVLLEMSPLRLACHSAEWTIYWDRTSIWKTFAGPLLPEPSVLTSAGLEILLSKKRMLVSGDTTSVPFGWKLRALLG